MSLDKIAQTGVFLRIAADLKLGKKYSCCVYYPLKPGSLFRIREEDLIARRFCRLANKISGITAITFSSREILFEKSGLFKWKDISRSIEDMLDLAQKWYWFIGLFYKSMREEKKAVIYHKGHQHNSIKILTNFQLTNSRTNLFTSSGRFKNRLQYLERRGREFVFELMVFDLTNLMEEIILRPYEIELKLNAGVSPKAVMVDVREVLEYLHDDLLVTRKYS